MRLARFIGGHIWGHSLNSNLYIIFITDTYIHNSSLLGRTRQPFLAVFRYSQTSCKTIAIRSLILPIQCWAFPFVVPQPVSVGSMFEGISLNRIMGIYATDSFADCSFAPAI